MKKINKLFNVIGAIALSTQVSAESIKTDIDLWPEIPAAIAVDPVLEKKLDTLMAKMSLAQKVGQMVQAEITWVTPKDVKKYHLGSVLNGGGTFLHGDRNASVSDWVSFMDELYLASMDTSDGGLAIPVTYGIDAVHGNNKFIGATIFPHNIGLGAARNPELIYKIGEATAKEVLLAGIDWTFAPTLAVARDDRWGRTYESYSEDPDIVALYAKEMIEGLQGKAGTKQFLDDDHIYATAKHWVGDGGTDKGIDQGDNLDSEKDLIAHHASGYFPAIKSGIQSIMASHNMWHGDRLHGSHYLLNDVLKGKLNFDGFIVGDWNSHGKVKGCRNDSCAQAINAGLDMFMVVEDWQAFITNTIAQVESGEVSMARIDDAVRRILRVKMRSGLFDKGLPSTRKYANQSQYLGAPKHKAIARQAVRESLVLLKNNNNLLPLSPNANILVAGDGADNMSKQTGGWTINWTGEGNKKSDFPGGSSIYDGIKSAVESAGGKTQLSPNGSFTEKPDVAIVVFGENPYAEWIGDIKSIAYQQHSQRDAKLLESLKSQNIPVVALFLSGRPLWMNRVINASDAFVAAWLPGSEGVGVSDVIFTNKQGDVQYDFTGKLSFSWPKYASQVVLNRGDSNYDPLFAYGFGLTYQDKVNLGQLSQENDFTFAQSNNSPYVVMKGRTHESWHYQVRTNQETLDVHTPMVTTKGFTMIEADHQIQGDAKEFTWHGNQAVDLVISSSWYREDLSGYLANQSALTFDIRTEQKPKGPVLINMGCGAKKCGAIDISEQLKKFPLHSWQKVSIDLLCFANAGVEFERSSAPFIISAKDSVKLRLANVQYTPAQAKTANIQCSQ
ncbi:glycoside hydrolase family 3 N-terminal domain-containing protein [Thalassotalea sp. PLHSN55]|uniref:glycoside hydrolase family 3 protein n=1 Tax=Thalassotalea sp. PLHSN55 TaxID=3435888 RepID=UPI003F839FA6